MANIKHVPSIGFVPVAFSVPARLCQSVSTDERLRCNLAPHAVSVRHAAYEPNTGVTLNW